MYYCVTTFTIVTDPDDDIDEAHENNNEDSIEVEVEEPEQESPLEIELDYSWHLESNYTSVPTYITNLSGYSVDVTVRIRAFNSDEVTIFDYEYTLEDIRSGETYYKPFNVTGTDTESVEVTSTDAYHFWL